MIKIDISGMADGEYEFDLSVPVNRIENIFEEFNGDVTIFVNVTKLGHRYTLRVNAKCNAQMICDRSLKEFNEIIESNFSLSFRADTKLFIELGNILNKNSETEIIIREDYKYIDISSEVIENLALELPMKRVAPEFRNKEISDIFPELKSDTFISEISTDDRWAILKDFKIN